METAQIMILILRILVNLYAQSQEYNPETDIFILKNKMERICLVGNFKGADEITICDNMFYNRCGLSNKQKIILLGQTQALIELDPYPFRLPESFYIHVTSKGKPLRSIGHRMTLGMVYTRIHHLN